MDGESSKFLRSVPERYRVLLEISELIAAHQRFEDLFRDLNKSLSSVLSFEGIAISLYDMRQRTARLFLLESCRPNDIPVGEIYSLEETPALEILKSQQPIYVPDLEQERRFPAIHQMLRRHGVRSYCIFPLSTARQCIGGLHLGSAKPNAYAAEDIDFMRIVAGHVAVALESVLNHESAEASREALARERDHLKLLLQVNDAISAKLDTRDLFSAISVCLREALNVEYASLTLFDPDTNQLRRHSLDFPCGGGHLQEGATIPIDGSTVGEAFSRATPVLARRADIERLPPKVREGLITEGLNFLCAVPLISRKRVLGTLNAASRREDAFTEEGVRLLEEVACQFAVALDNALAYGRIAELNAKLAEEKLYLADEIRSNYFFEEIIGNSRPLQNVLRQIEVVAPSDSTVLLSGETGTGKELVARAIHNLSGQRKATFVKLNCAAIPTGLLEGELFGHEKGAFTGAVSQRIGRFELASGGTLFLDEIGDIPLELQPKLLRVLQENEFERLGSARTIHADVRLIAATNRDLSQMVKVGEFRADLYYRLNVFPIVMPPLRERREDIPLLVRYFVQQVARRMGKLITTIHSDTMESFVHYPWPGNIRELQNIIERAVILSPGQVLMVPAGELKTAMPAPGGNPQTLEEAERRHILQALHEANWVVGGAQGAAARLGMKRSTLQFRMQKLGIFRPR
jgi:formate hydrogenlyase transcriptional activator